MGVRKFGTGTSIDLITFPPYTPYSITPHYIHHYSQPAPYTLQDAPRDKRLVQNHLWEVKDVNILSFKVENEFRSLVTEQDQMFSVEYTSVGG